MESRAKALGHAIHPMLIPFPLGLLATAVVFDIDYLSTGRSGFAVAAAYMIGAGIIGGLLVVVLFAVSWLLRVTNGWEPTAWALVCSFAAVVLAVVTAWLGGELVERLGVGVDEAAGIDAPSSLSHRHVAA
jgi:uncharacterized membrane protein